MTIHTGALLVAFALAAAALSCQSSSGGTDAGTDPGADAADPGTDSGNVTKSFLVAGDITADVAWSELVRLTADARILPGVTVTVAAGTAFRGAAATNLLVEGTLLVQGTEAAHVTFGPDAGSTSWGGLEIASGGTLGMSWADATATQNVVLCDYGAVACDLDNVHFYDVPRAVEYWGPGTISYATFERMNDGGVTVQAGADLLIADSWIRSSASDLIVMGGGALVLDHCELGLAGQTGADYEHCLIHVNGSDLVSVTYTNFVDGEYAAMIGYSNGSVYNFNNFEASTFDINNLGGNGGIDLTQNYWSNGAPSLGPAFDTSAPSAAPIAGAGPR